MSGAVRPFGTTAAGEEIDEITIAGGGLTARLLTRGAILRDLRLDGVDHGLTLGSEDIADYEGAHLYSGAIVGPVANRISGAAAEIGGARYEFPANEGANLLHSGDAGLHAKCWRIDAVEPEAVQLSVTLEDGEGGFPGRRAITARFACTAGGRLRMVLTASTDAPTWVNLANHSYWNLGPEESWAGHEMRIAAEHYLPVNDATLPTGEIRAVAGTGYDFRAGRAPEAGAPPLDHNFCLSDARGALREVLWLTGPTGVQMTVATTEPGMQVYDGRGGFGPGTAGYQGFAIEAQGWPDAPTQSGFPSVALLPGETYEQVTEWQFDRG